MSRAHLASLVALGLLTAACGSWTGEAEGPEAPPAPPPPPAAPPPPPEASAAPAPPPPAAPAKTATGGWFDEDPPAEGGVIGGTAGDSVSPSGVKLVPFVDGMTRPQRIAGTVPAYTQKAIDANAEGKVLVKCVILATGEPRDCRVIKSVPALDPIVLDALKTWRFSPAQKDGKPVAIEYVLPFTFKLPARPAPSARPPLPPGARSL